MSESWCRPKAKELRHATNFTDPIPESKQNLQTYKIKEKFTLNIKNDDVQNPEYVQTLQEYE